MLQSSRTDLYLDNILINSKYAFVTMTPKRVSQEIKLKKNNNLNFFNSLLSIFISFSCLVGWGCRIHRLLLCRGVRSPSPNEDPGYDTKQSDVEVLVLLKLRGTPSTPSLPSLPGPLSPGVVALDKGPIYGLNRTKPWLLDLTVFCI